jgi:hypothetical protein
MSQPSNGITPDVIRGAMAPYHLSPDLLAATLAALPRPPPDATESWRHDRIARLLQEIDAYKPADSGQARIAAQLLITREAADAFTTRIHDPDLTIEQQCRVGRTAAELLRSAAGLERTLARHQQMPASFYGTVVQDQVDIAALDATWHRNPPPPHPTPAATTPPTQRHAAPPAPNHPAPASPAIPLAAATPTPPSEATPPTNPPPDPTYTPDPTSHPETPAAATPEWTRTLLDQGPGWSREVLRRRNPQEPESDPTP